MKKTILAFSLVSILTASASFAATSYQCTFVAGDQGDDVSLTVAGNKVYGELDGDKDSGTINKDYTPRTGDENYIEYTGFGAFLGDEGTVEMLVSKELVRGESKGTMKLRARGEGYTNTVYSCTEAAR